MNEEANQELLLGTLWRQTRGDCKGMIFKVELIADTQPTLCLEYNQTARFATNPPRLRMDFCLQKSYFSFNVHDTSQSESKKRNPVNPICREHLLRQIRGGIYEQVKE